ncbi:MAG: GFA family protein [Ramlibacter sp.]
MGTTYKGSCHCGDVTFEVEGDIDSALACNCSICSRKGSLLWFVPRDRLRLTTPEGNASTYMFNKHVIRHRFCARCGIHPFGEGTDPKGNAMAAVNLRCLDGIDLDAIPVHRFNGRDL